MKKPAHNLVAYNTQITVDEKFKLIVATDVSSNGNDLEQLHNMSVQSKENLEVQELDIVGDVGYFSAKEIKKCVDDNIKISIPEGNKTQGQKNKGKYTRDAFKYDSQNDCYVCPNNKSLKKQYRNKLKMKNYTINMQRQTRIVMDVHYEKNACHLRRLIK
ncbi:MAG: transposase [Gammaproteobacteria bacterium]